MQKPNAYFDMAYIQEMSAGDIGIQKDLIQLLLQELERELPKAKSLLEQKEGEGLERFCHHFKSTIAFSGNQAIITANQKLWKIASAQNPDWAMALQAFEQIEQQAEFIEQAAKNELEKL